MKNKLSRSLHACCLLPAGLAPSPRCAAPRRVGRDRPTAYGTTFRRRQQPQVKQAIVRVRLVAKALSISPHPFHRRSSIDGNIRQDEYYVDL